MTWTILGSIVVHAPARSSRSGTPRRDFPRARRRNGRPSQLWTSHARKASSPRSPSGRPPAPPRRPSAAWRMARGAKAECPAWAPLQPRRRVRVLGRGAGAPDDARRPGDQDRILDGVKEADEFPRRPSATPWRHAVRLFQAARSTVAPSPCVHRPRWVGPPSAPGPAIVAAQLVRPKPGREAARGAPASPFLRPRTHGHPSARGDAAWSNADGAAFRGGFQDSRARWPATRTRQAAWRSDRTMKPRRPWRSARRLLSGSRASLRSTGQRRLPGPEPCGRPRSWSLGSAPRSARSPSRSGPRS